MTKRSVINMSPRSKAQFEELREASMKKIFDASLELFGTKGFEATSIAQIAKLAGISKGLIYNYFDSKEDLLKAMIDNLFSIGDEMMAGLFVDDPKIALENLIKAVFQWFRTNDRLNRLMISLATQIDRFQFVHDLAINKTNVYLKMLEELFNKMNYPEAKMEARMLGTFLDGVSMHIMVMKDDYPMQEVEEMLINKYCK